MMTDRFKEEFKANSDWLKLAFHANSELPDKPFILNVYRCVHREQVEKYLQPLVDNLLLGVIEEESAGMTVREEDKRFIARIYGYIFLGLMLDWIKDDMRGDPQAIVGRLAVLIKGSMAAALSRFSP